MATTHRTGDFCSIVLAGGSGSQLFPLIENCPKCLLNVGNYPILYYSLRALEISGFDEKIKITIDSLKMKIKANFHTISDYIEHNTASVLASMQSLLTCDNVLVLSGDVFGEISLRNMASTFRKRDATFCAYIQPMVAEARPNTQMPPKLTVPNGSAGSQHPSNNFDSVSETIVSADFVAFNLEDDRLLICVNECNIEEGLRH
ncbi:hypothetical protein MXB_2085 [Myxobolus squamalis]|nr:hypothetical protein MXB_2085 [Myxobolus squamalis]